MEKLERGKYTATLQLDEEPLNPRKEYDNLCTMVCEHRYELGDTTMHGLTGLPTQRFKGPDELKLYMILHYDVATFEWLGVLDHSGLHMYLGGGSHWTDTDGWDSGTAGFMFMTWETAVQAFEDNHEERAHNVLMGELEEYNSYLAGDVYGYEIRDEEGDVVDSCWGLLGYSNAMSEMEGALEHLVGGE